MPYIQPIQTHIYLNQEEVLNGSMKGFPMPDRSRLKYYLKAYRNTFNVFSTKVEDVKNMIKTHIFSPEIPETTSFFFGFKFDEFNEPIVCNVENADNSIRIGMTSKKLLSFVRDIVLRNMIFHLGCTYRLTKNRFPFLVFGFSDLNGQFHPIAFVLISHERSGDFDWFFGALKNVFNSMGILFSPTYMMMDANDASYIAVEKHFPNCIVLMCFFHVNFNVKKSSKFYPIANQEGLKKETFLNKLSSMGLHDLELALKKNGLVSDFGDGNCFMFLKIVMTKVVNYHSRQEKESMYYRVPDKDLIDL
ncbi:hypothetical protein BpHYR1_009397 [Brachionus plicatilis]|uniref:MULE transposase domain-containing protein n=1 Tax=Brachionus plicatilis TaxID=10195 RepID=A0A3M7PGV1_BRAPC|nr:hypothetical protein BpHYR1_009397 [Brachionus plicatilis]